MANWDELQADVTRSVAQFEEEIKDFQQRMYNQIEGAKRDEVLAEMKKINTRLDRIEQMFPEQGDGFDDVVTPKR